MIRKLLFLLIGLILIPATSWSVELYKNGDASMSVGLWSQVWYQNISDYDHDADGTLDGTLNDFMVRRIYFSVKGSATSDLSFFMHYAGDRIGQDGLDKSGVGLGSGLAVRDAWINYKIHGNDLMVQVGRMYIPFTRNYGTTSTKALLTTELDWGQGGIRSGIFYPSKVGRDDSITLWGNVLDDKLQYRFMVGEGAESATTNPDDELRFAGRLSLNLFDPETSWFNKGTYLGKKKILAIGAGFDCQSDLMLDGKKRNYEAYTADIHLDMPLNENGDLALTAEAAYIKINHSVGSITWTDLKAGGSGDIVEAKAGILLAGKIQPFAHYEKIMPDAHCTDDTNVYGVGCNYYIKGLGNKLTAEWTVIDDYKDETVDIITVQLAFGF